MPLFDSHAHISLQSSSEWPLIFDHAIQKDVLGIMNISTDEESFIKRKKCVHPEISIYQAAATPPHDLKTDFDPFFQIVQEAAFKQELSAIGETGLDYFHGKDSKEIQKKYFARYIELANTLQLPLIVHCREAFADLFSIAKKISSPCILHCFTGTIKEAEKLLDLGWYISFSGIVTYPKNELLRNAARFVPLEKMLIETDSPYLAPQQVRGKKNEPAFIQYIAQTIAKEKNLPLEEITRTTFENALGLFSPNTIPGLAP